jgi:LmbE family N-acetylglucosaminyl deacetylase
MSENIEFVRLVGNERRVGPTLAGVSRHWQQDKERFLMISPHDDDIAIGGGLLVQLARRENVAVHVLIVTDGSMGYCSAEEKPRIAAIRREETFACYQKLGVPRENIVWMGFPDCRVNKYRGRFAAESDKDPQIEGFTGLQNHFTHYLRKIAPTQCFLPTSADLHPDHRFVHEELFISLFHAMGDIWPELGPPIARVPWVHELAVYCDFPGPPTLRMTTPMSYLQTKLDAIAAFQSQRQIAVEVENIRNGGPQEYVRAVEFRLYHPSIYRNLFEEREWIANIR